MGSAVIATRRLGRPPPSGGSGVGTVGRVPGGAVVDGGHPGERVERTLAADPAIIGLVPTHDPRTEVV